MLEKTLLDFKQILLSRKFLLAAPEEEDEINRQSLGLEAAISSLEFSVWWNTGKMYNKVGN